VQAKQLQAIDEHNSKLPPKKAKEALPELSSSNVYAKAMVKRDPKKNTLELIHKYKNVGYAPIDEGTDNAPNSVKNFTLRNQTMGL